MVCSGDIRSITCSVLAVMVVCVGAAAGWSDAAPLDSEATAYGKVTLIRDAYGIPHIFADSDEGAMYGLGYATAEDRMFQMEYSRRIVKGTLAEMVGNIGSTGKTTVDSDEKNRHCQYYTHAETLAGNMAPSTQALLQAYSDGVNRYLEDNAAHIHYLFGVYGVTPEPWTPADCIATWERVAQFFSGGFNGEAKVLHDFEALIDGGMTWEEAIEAMTVATVIDEAAAVVQEADFDPAARAELDAYAAAHGYGGGSSARLRSLPTEPEFIHFSHAWVIGGTRSTTGAAVLCSDPQTTVRNPAVWHEAHVKGATFDARGISFPGCPGFIIGWNHGIAWGVTALGGDLGDTFRLDMKPGDPTKYIYDSVEYDLDIWTEDINVRGGSPVPITLKRSHIGPIVTELMNNVHAGEEYALKNVYLAFDDTHTVEAAFEMMRAGDVAEFSLALDGFRGPGVHMLFGDTNGDIGYWTQAAIPLRSPLSPLGGRASQYGTGAAYDWVDIIPHNIMPHVINPTGGVIFSGNHLPVGAWYPLPGIAGTGDSQRSWRLRQHLTGPEIFEPLEMIDVHLDDVNPARMAMLRAGYHVRANGGTFNAAAENLLDLLVGWYATGSHCDTAHPYYAGAHHMRTNFRAADAPVLSVVYGGGDGGLSYFLKTLEAKMDANPADILDADEKAYIQRALEYGWNTAVSNYGADPNDWFSNFNSTNGQLFVPYYTTLEGFPSLDPAQDFLSALLHDVLTGTIWSQKGNSYSQWVNLADVENSLAVLPTGVSEVPESPFYRCEQEIWEDGVLRAAPLNRSTNAPYIRVTSACGEAGEENVPVAIWVERELTFRAFELTVSFGTGTLAQPTEPDVDVPVSGVPTVDVTTPGQVVISFSSGSPQVVAAKHALATIDFDVLGSPSEMSTALVLSDVTFTDEDFESFKVGMGGPGSFKVIEGITPTNPSVATGQWVHFSTILGSGGVWSLLSSESGPGVSIDADSGLYHAGQTGGTTDIVQVTVGLDTVTTAVSVHATQIYQGGPGLPTSTDVNGEGIGLSDVILELRRLVGLDSFAPDQEAAADFDCDGSASISDAVNCLRVLVGLPPAL